MSVKIDGNGPITGADSTFSTGDFKWRQAQTPGAGWITATGGTIGNSGSGATNRANADTLALFTLWWTDYTDAQLPIQTVTGAASTRGASAVADWAAGKRLTVFDVRGRFIRAPGTINTLTFVNGNSYADTLKDHSHAITQMVGLPGSGGTSGYTYNNAGTGAPLGAGNTQFAGGGAETAPVSIVMLPCYKL